jgi:hypothetical protein
MTGRINKLGTLVLAVLALAATQAATASAEPLFHSEVEHTLGVGSQEGSIVFTTDPGTVTCNKITGSGTLAKKTATEVTLNSAYSECALKTIFGTIAITINMNGCEYIATADIEVHMICPAGKTMVISGPGCTLTVPPQSATSVTYTNVGTGTTRELIAEEQGTGITYSYSGFTCGSGTNTTNGTATGKVRITATDTNGKHVGIWWTDV